MKKLAILLAAVVAVAVLFLLVPPETKSSLGESWLRLTGDPGQACFDYERPSFNDPITAKLQHHVKLSESTGEIAIAFLAKNSFGAYVPGEASCIIKSGKIDVIATERLRAREKLSRAREQALQDLATTSACLQDRIEKLKAGRAVSSVPCPGQ